MLVLQNVKVTTVILFLFYILLTFPGCHHRPPNPLGMEYWTLDTVSQWLADKKLNLKQITAWGKVSLISEGEQQEGFEAFISLDNKGQGRIEGLGPWKKSIFSIIFNQDNVYFYLSKVPRLYLCQNNPQHIQQLFGLPIDFTYLFYILSANLPSGLSLCPDTPSQGEIPPVLCIRGKLRNITCKAKVLLKDIPLVEELNCEVQNNQEGFRIIYSQMQYIDGDSFPKNIYITWPKGLELHIILKSIKFNQPTSSTFFLPNPDWFSGEVIDLQE